MAVKNMCSNYVIVIAPFGDWPKNLMPVFQLVRSKSKTNSAPCTCDFSLALTEAQVPVIARNSDWFIELFAPVVIVWSNYTLWYCFFLFCFTALLFIISWFSAPQY